MGKDLISMGDLSAEEVLHLLAAASELKKERRLLSTLAGKTLGMILQKPSTRTAVSFSVAMAELGGIFLTLQSQDLQMRRGETMADTARTLSRYVSLLMIRAHRHADVEELAASASVPVINGLTDREHPCQVLADLMTLVEVFHLPSAAALKSLKVTYVGDGNNMVNSWMLAAGLLGFRLTLSCPEGYDPDPALWERARAMAATRGGQVEMERDPLKAAREAHALYTDVWTSMGQEAEQERRRLVFQPYQLNAHLMAAARPEVVAMHCLPAHRGEEISAEVMDGPRSVVFEQAENRLHVQKAVLLRCLDVHGAPKK